MEVELLESHLFRYANGWWNSVVPDSSQQAIKYLEFGAFRGMNLVSVGQSFAAHPDSRIYAVDTWTDDEEGQYNTNYMNALLAKYNLTDKVTVLGGELDAILNTMDDESLDIIYIDHLNLSKMATYCELAARKVKRGGFVIFDDTHEPSLCEAIDAVYNDPVHNMSIVLNKNEQRFYQKAL
jgi:predicted O-methyltransferase YrrM